MPAHHLVAVEPDPDDGDLGAAVDVERDEVREVTALDHVAHGGGEPGHQSACSAARTSSAGSGWNAPGVSTRSRCTVPLNGAGGV